MALKSVAKGRIVINDLTDSRQLVAYLSSTNRRQVIYNPDTNEYLPNYATVNNVLSPELYLSGSTLNKIDDAVSVTWSVQTNSMGAFTPVVANQFYAFGAKHALIIKDNILKDNLSMLYKVDIVYHDIPLNKDILIQTDIEIVKLSNGSAGVGEDAVVALLSNDLQTISTDSQGDNGNFTSVESAMDIYVGAKEDTANWTLTFKPSAGVTGKVLAPPNNNNYQVTAMTVDNGYVDFTATKGTTTLSKRFTLTKVKQGVSGVDATIYRLKKSHAVIIRNRDKVLTPGVVYFSSTLLVGNEENDYKGFYSIYERSSTNPQGTYIKQYESVSAESTKAYTPKPDVSEIKIELYKDSARSQLLDTETVMVADDGEDAYKVEILSTNGNIFKNGIIDTWIYAVVYKGSEDVTNEIELSRFRWTKTSSDPVADQKWNAKYFGGAKEIKLTTDDIYKRATFECKII